MPGSVHIQYHLINPPCYKWWDYEDLKIKYYKSYIPLAIPNVYHHEAMAFSLYVN